MSVEIFKQGSDNWGYLLTNKKLGEAVAIDPLDPAPYLSILREKNLRLVGILATHYHDDHIEGIPALLQEQLVPVVGPNTKEAPTFVTHKVGNDSFNLESFDFESHFLPGHSNSHCLYRDPKKNYLFVGDILFHLGCGRVIDCDPIVLFESLQYLKDFPTYSDVFVGHDYREKNLRFCMQLDPKTYSALHLSDLDKCTTLEMEMWWNPFLKAKAFDEWWDLRQQRNSF